MSAVWIPSLGRKFYLEDSDAWDAAAIEPIVFNKWRWRSKDRRASARRSFVAVLASGMWHIDGHITGSVCWICGRAKSSPRSGNRVNSTLPDGLVLDHCHETGAIRGILCSPCNSGEAAAPIWTNMKYRANAKALGDLGFWFCCTRGGIPAPERRPITLGEVEMFPNIGAACEVFGGRLEPPERDLPEIYAMRWRVGAPAEASVVEVCEMMNARRGRAATSRGDA